MTADTIIGDGLCECGCGQKTAIATQSSSAFGWVKGEPKRFVQYHHARKTAHRVGYEITADGCWLTNRALNPQGYGTDWEFGTEHRRRYIEKYGQPQAGHDLHHTCENRRCVNPDHLEVLTRKEHRNRHSRTTPESRLEIATQANAGRRAAEIAEEFGVSKGLVYTLAYNQRKGKLT